MKSRQLASKSLVWERIPSFWAFKFNFGLKNHKMSIFRPFCLSKVYICIHTPPKLHNYASFDVWNSSLRPTVLEKMNFKEFWVQLLEKMPGGSRFWSKLLNFDLGSLIILGINQKIGTRHNFAKKVIWSPP